MHLRSWKGQIEVVLNRWSTPTQDSSFRWSSNPTDEWQSMIDKAGGQGITGPEAFGLGWGRLRPDFTRAVAPHWFFSFVFGALALAFKPKPRWQFSLRELLLVTTLAVLTVGAVCSLHRWN